MKKYVLLSTVLVVIAGWSGNGFCQTPSPGCPPNNLGIIKPAVFIYNAENDPVVGNGTYLQVVVILPGSTGSLMNGLERIYAQNTDSQIDGDVLEIGLTPTLRNIGPGFEGYKEFKGQSGMYEVAIWRSTSVEPPLRPLPLPCAPQPPDCYCPPQPLPDPYPRPFTCYADPIEDGLIPLPVPKNLKVSFESGATTPTLSFDPVGELPSDSSEWYNIRIYDKDYSRRIYAVTIGREWCGSSNGNRAACSIVGSNPSVTFPAVRAGTTQTYEDLVPGEEYIFRADLWKELPYPSGSTICSSPQCNLIQASNFKRFKVPKK